MVIRNNYKIIINNYYMVIRNKYKIHAFFSIIFVLGLY